MALSQLQITNVRNLREVHLQALASVNVFYGSNGSGKTSVLEAIHLLGMARSFRGNSVKTVISHDQPACTVFGQRALQAGSGALPLGITRHRTGGVDIKIAGESVQRVSKLAECLPVQVINADSFNLLTGSPNLRRQYLDWGVFHVEHRFFAEWQRFQRSIKQRNKLLRHAKMDAAQLEAWNSELGDSGEAITAYRQACFEQLIPRFLALVESLAPSLAGRLSLRLRQGWDASERYLDVLRRNLETDFEQGFTQVGPQRADIKVTVDGHPAAETLSRGQQKMVVCALKLAQGRLMADTTHQGSLYLVDDLPSELDAEHCRLVCQQLAALGAQVFITCVDRADVERAWPQSAEAAMFHVEHGAIAKN